MHNLKTIEGKVRAILEKDEEARNDDMTLYLAVCNACLKGTGAMPFAEVMSQYRHLGLPSFESVGRTRRKLQEKEREELKVWVRTAAGWDKIDRYTLAQLREVKKILEGGENA